jgi:uncharacterized protein YjiS (DUF1127 family)
MSTRLELNFIRLSVPAFRPLSRQISLRALPGWIRALVARWRQRRLLEELDDRSLRDIGISRSEALAEARKPFWRM